MVKTETKTGLFGLPGISALFFRCTADSGIFFYRMNSGKMMLSEKLKNKAGRGKR